MRLNFLIDHITGRKRIRSPEEISISLSCPEKGREEELSVERLQGNPTSLSQKRCRITSLVVIDILDDCQCETVA